MSGLLYLAFEHALYNKLAIQKNAAKRPYGYKGSNWLAAVAWMSACIICGVALRNLRRQYPSSKELCTRRSDHPQTRCLQQAHS